MNNKQRELFDAMYRTALWDDIKNLRDCTLAIRNAESRLKTVNLLAGGSLRKARESRGISLRKCARDMGISPTYLSDIERGRRMLPKELWS